MVVRNNVNIRVCEGGGVGFLFVCVFKNRKRKIFVVSEQVTPALPTCSPPALMFTRERGEEREEKKSREVPKEQSEIALIWCNK